MQVADPTVAAGILAIAALLAASAFFSGSEIAIFSLERHRLGALLGSDDPRAAALGRLREDPHRLLVTILVGNTVVNIAMASIASVVLATLYGPGVAVTGATLGMSFLVLVFGEITPKSYGVSNAESVSLRVVGPIAVLQRVFVPVVLFFEVISAAINRVTGGSIEIERPYVTRDEIETLMRTGEELGDIDETEREMVTGVFELGDTIAREVMVPRVNVVGVEADAPLYDVLRVCAENRLTRVPVYEGTLDHVVGIADIRDVERAVQQGLDLEEVLLPTLQVPDTRDIDDLLSEMQDERVTMVIVRDEFGEAEGIITVEDILEEIVGEIFEVGEERLVRSTSDGLMVRGEVTLGEVNDTLEVNLPRDGDFETVAGLINDTLGRIGDVGDSVEIDGVSLTVEGVDGHRIRRVRVRQLPDGEETADEEVTSDEEEAADAPAADEETDAGPAVDGSTDGDEPTGPESSTGARGRDAGDEEEDETDEEVWDGEEDWDGEDDEPSGPDDAPAERENGDDAERRSD